MLLGGLALRERGLAAAARIAAVSGCRLLCETFPARVERGAGMPAVERLPYFPEQVLDTLGKFETIVLAGAREPVAFFGYPNLPSRLVPDGCGVETLATPEQDVVTALEALAEAIGASRSPGAQASLNRPALPTGAAERDDRRRGAGGADARGRDCDGRGGDHRPAILHGVGGSAAAYLPRR